MVRDRLQALQRCPHCGAEVFIKWGSKNGRQRFRCKDATCGKTFSASTGSPLSGLHYPELHKKNAECMVDGLSIRKVAARLGINKSTAFRWRHRFLDPMQGRQPAKLGCVVEADETFFLESYKGSRNLPAGRKPKKRGTPAEKRGLSTEQIPVLVARDRSTGTTLTVVLRNRSASDIGEVLLPRLSADTELFSDGASAYRTLARKHEIALRIVPSHPKHKTSGAVHINNVNAYDSRLKGWMSRFKGVATKNLPNYLGWHRYLDATHGASAREFLNVALS